MACPALPIPRCIRVADCRHEPFHDSWQCAVEQQQSVANVGRMCHGSSTISQIKRLERRFAWWTARGVVRGGRAGSRVSRGAVPGRPAGTRSWRCHRDAVELKGSWPEISALARPIPRRPWCPVPRNSHALGNWGRSPTLLDAIPESERGKCHDSFIITCPEVQ
jgi:hypothetical protein